MSDKNLYEASHQWATRPDDERFESLPAMLTACRAHRDSAATSTVPVGALRAEASGSDIVLTGATGKHAKLTHYAFGQISRLAGAPAEYLRRLPATLATQNLNYGLKNKDQTDKLSLLFHQNGSLVARAITTDSYDRVWNADLVQRINDQMVPAGWVVPPARPARPGQKGTRRATEADILPDQSSFGLAVKVGDEIAPAGLYASDHDMFAFLVNQTDPVFDGQKFLNRGVFIQNSEVGDCALKLKLFTYDNVCGNHIVWGAANVTEISLRHVKGEFSHGQTLNKALLRWSVMMYQMPTADQLKAQIHLAQTKEIAGSKDDVLDALFGFAKKRGLNRLSRPVLAAAYDTAENTPRYGSPRSVWGIVNGLTENSQQTAYTDNRTEMDLQAGRIMEMAF